MLSREVTSQNEKARRCGVLTGLSWASRLENVESCLLLVYTNGYKYTRGWGGLKLFNITSHRLALFFFPLCIIAVLTSSLAACRCALFPCGRFLTVTSVSSNCLRKRWGLTPGVPFPSISSRLRLFLAHTLVLDRNSAKRLFILSSVVSFSTG